MNLLMVSPHLPSPSWGASTRSYHLLKALAREHTVSLIALTADTSDEAQDAALAEMKLKQFIKLPLSNSLQSKRMQQVLSILRGRSRLLDAYRIEAVQQVLDDLFASDHYDLVLFESVFMVDYRLPEGTQVVIDQHNIEYELLQRTYQREKSLARKWYNWWESRCLKPVELERCRKAQGILVTSEREALLLKSLLPGGVVAVVPNGVDTEAFQVSDPQQLLPDSVIFTGTMDYYPNIDGVLYFAHKCWPLIRSKVPTATWQIVGRNPPAEVQDLAKLAGVSVTGSVSDVKPYLAAATVAIAPLLIGSGTRLKILEALAMGKAMVSTSQGAEGLAVTSGEHLIVADQPEVFAQSVVDLLQNAEQRTALASAGRVLAETEYSWKRCGDDLIHALEKIRGEP
jgi:sugar transferase (PEP-CTERM/EpsH1 system associated)